MYGSVGTVAGCVLLLEEDEGEARRLRTELELEGYRVEWSAEGRSGLKRAREPDVDLVILELALPGLDGFRLLRALRRGGSDVPAIVLSACSEETYKVLGLRSGADDYVTKPFGTAELLARVEAQLRRAGKLLQGHPGGAGGLATEPWTPGGRDRPGVRSGNGSGPGVSFSAFPAPALATLPPPATGPLPRRGHGAGPGAFRRRRPTLPAVVSLGSVEVDTSTHVVTKDGEEVPLTPKEFALLLALVRRGGAVASRSELLDEVWDARRRPTRRTVDTHVFELRRKLEDDPSSPRHLLTVRKVGYRLGT